MAARKRQSATTPNERRYEDIVNIAGELFAAKGFNGTSLNEIADAVGVLKGSLYHYISSKEDLLFDVIRVSHQGLQEVISLAEPFSDEPVHHLAAFCYGHVFLNATPERMSRGIVFLHDAKNLSPKKRSQVMGDRDSYSGYLRNIIARGQQLKKFDTELDVKLASFDVFGVITSYSRWYKPGGPLTPHMLGRESAAFVLASVASAQQRQQMTSRFTIVDEVIEKLRANHKVAAAV